jgi:hypothetical protein
VKVKARAANANDAVFLYGATVSNGHFHKFAFQVERIKSGKCL